MFDIDGRGHEVSAADGVTQRVSMEPADSPQPDHSEPDAHRDSRSTRSPADSLPPRLPRAEKPTRDAFADHDGRGGVCRGITGMIEQSATYTFSIP